MNEKFPKHAITEIIEIAINKLAARDSDKLIFERESLTIGNRIIRTIVIIESNQIFSLIILCRGYT